jgi:hypothetical protein
MLRNRYFVASKEIAFGYTTPLVMPPFMMRSQKRSIGGSCILLIRLLSIGAPSSITGTGSCWFAWTMYILTSSLRTKASARSPSRWGSDGVRDLRHRRVTRFLNPHPMLPTDAHQPIWDHATVRSVDASVVVSRSTPLLRREGHDFEALSVNAASASRTHFAIRSRSDSGRPVDLPRRLRC